jgi:hypothetical protein
MALSSLPDVLISDPPASLPKKLIVPRHVTIINANMTAYSTAVVPQSSRRKCKILFMIAPFFPSTARGHNAWGSARGHQYVDRLEEVRARCAAN